MSSKPESCADAWNHPIQWDESLAGGIGVGRRGEYSYTIEDTSEDGDGTGPWSATIHTPQAEEPDLDLGRPFATPQEARDACGAWRPRKGPVRRGAFEYKVDNEDFPLPENEQKHLNEMGAQGWELVAVTVLHGEQRADRLYMTSLRTRYWKRRVEVSGE